MAGGSNNRRQWLIRKTRHMGWWIAALLEMRLMGGRPTTIGFVDHVPMHGGRLRWDGRTPWVASITSLCSKCALVDLGGRMSLYARRWKWCLRLSCSTRRPTKTISWRFWPAWRYAGVGNLHWHAVRICLRWWICRLRVGRVCRRCMGPDWGL